MYISTEIGSISKYVGELKAIELVAKAGFNAFDFSMFDMARYDYENKSIKVSTHPLYLDNYLEYVYKIKEVATNNNIICNQAHAPFPSYGLGMEKYLIRAIECASILNAKCIVIHPKNNDDITNNVEMYNKLLPYAKKYNIKIAIENMWNWSKSNNKACQASCSHHNEFRKLIDTLDSDYIVACLDIGHAEMDGLDTSSLKMINTLNEKLFALHIHDNDLKHDYHQIPFAGKIDFKAIVRCLKSINYQGDITLEADTYTSTCNKDIESACNDLANAAKKLRKLYEEL